MKKVLSILLVAGSLLAAEHAMRLADVRNVYIEKMPNGLDNYLRSSISKKFHNRLTLVLDKEHADAVMSGVDMGAQKTRSATVTLNDPKANVVLWSGTAGDRDAKMLSIKHGGEEKVADNLIGQLKKAMER
jgi:hypothetical protein